MTVHRIAIPFLFALSGALPALAVAGPAQESPTEQVRQVAAWLSGSFSNRQQAARDKSFHHVVLHMQPIWTQRQGEFWLYVEQALAETADKPYRQRVYRIRWDGGPVSDVFLLPGDPAAFVGAWRNTDALARLTPENLLERDGCSIALHKATTGHYEGATRGKSCSSERSGASYATSAVSLSAASLTSWDRGFDSGDKQVWGSEAGPYRFEREN